MGRIDDGFSLAARGKSQPHADLAVGVSLPAQVR
jgi:hypothetical protein